MTDPVLIKEIMNEVSKYTSYSQSMIFILIKMCHFGEALEVDCIDESEVLTMTDKDHHINKHTFKIPFVCEARNLGEALRRISEGAAIIRIKGVAGTGNIINAV